MALLPKTQHVQNLLAVPTALTLDVSRLFVPPTQTPLVRCPRCAAFSPPDVACDICENSGANRTVFTSQGSSDSIPLVFVVNLSASLVGYAVAYLRALAISAPTTRVLLLVSRDRYVSVHDLRTEYTLVQDEWLLNTAHHLVECRLLDEETLFAAFEHTTPFTHLPACLVGLLSTHRVHCVIFSDTGLTLPSTAARAIAQASTCVDQFVFASSPHTEQDITLSTATNGDYLIVTPTRARSFTSLCQEHIQQRRLYLSRIHSVTPGFRVVAVAPQARVLSSRHSLTLFLETVVDRKDFRTVQFQLVYTTDDGAQLLAVITRTFATTLQLQKLYLSVQPAVFLVNLLKYAQTVAAADRDDLRLAFKRLLFGALLNYASASALGNFPYNSDVLCAACCSILSTPALCPDDVDAPEHASAIRIKAFLQRLDISREPASRLLPVFLRTLYVLKFADPPVLLKTPLSLAFAPQKTWLVLRVDDRLTHFVLQDDPNTHAVLGDADNTTPPEVLAARWKAFVASSPVVAQRLQELKLDGLAATFRLVPDMTELDEQLYTHMLFRHNDPVLYKIDLTRRIEERMRRNDVAMLYPRF